MITRFAVAAACLMAIVSTPAFAQAKLHGYVQGIGGLTSNWTTGSLFGAGAGIRVTPDLRIGAEIGRMSDVAPREVSEQFNDRFMAARGVHIGLRLPALYGTGGVTYLVPVRGRLRPYLSGSVGLAKLTAKMRVTGSGPFADEIRADIASTETPGRHGATRVLTGLGTGVNIHLRGSVGIEAGYRYGKIFAEDLTIHTNRLYSALTVGF